jgi:hypothetical protein
MSLGPAERWYGRFLHPTDQQKGKRAMQQMSAPHGMQYAFILPEVSMRALSLSFFQYSRFSAVWQSTPYEKGDFLIRRKKHSFPCCSKHYKRGEPEWLAGLASQTVDKPVLCVRSQLA